MSYKIYSLIFVFYITFLVGLKSIAETTVSNSHFKLKFKSAGIVSLKCSYDAYNTDYIMMGEILGHILVRYRIGDRNWQEISTSMMAEDGRRRTTAPTRIPPEQFITYNFASRYGWGEDVEMSERFRMEGEALIWTLRFRNLTAEPVEIGDIALSLPFNTNKGWNWVETETKRVIRHSFISGHGSFFFWMRPNSVGPYLVMVPLYTCPDFELADSFRPTKLEYFEKNGESYHVFIHSAVSGAMARERGGNWRQENTSVVLSPKYEPGDEVTYGFKFRWADGYDGVRDVLYEEGLIDVHVVPGMTVPEDLEVMFSLRKKKAIESVTAEYPEETRIEYLGEKAKDTHIYRVKFSRLGENLLTVKWGKVQKMVLEFFVAEPLEVLIKKRAAFLANKQLVRDPDKWYDGLVSDWDMKNKRLLRPDDKEEQSFEQMFGGFIRIQDILTSGDPMLCKAPYIAAKNVHYPLQEEVEAVDYHLKYFVWGKLQLTDKEKPHPYGIYGLPNWKLNRESKEATKPGHWEEQVSRAYDYPHYIMLYLNMYRIAKNYPGIKTELDKEEYLKRAYGTARAYFTLPYKRNPLEHNLLENKPTAQTTGMYNELVIVDLIEELYASRMTEEAEWLKNEWEKKMEYFVNEDPYLWGTEFAFGPTGFESTHALAKYAIEQIDRSGSILEGRYDDAVRFMEKQIKANIATRGWLEPSYYLLGTAYKYFSGYASTLSYMSQMGGWSILDYALYYSEEAEKYLRLGYASFLSSWALMNTGTPETNYGYWYPGSENDGAAASEFFPGSFGRCGYTGWQRRGAIAYGGEIDLGYEAALRTAATVVADDALFGLIAYGGQLSKTRRGIEVIPRDGLRQRIHMIEGKKNFHMVLNRDGFAKDEPIFINNTFSKISFTLENRTGNEHLLSIKMLNLPLGTYAVLLNNNTVSSFRVEDKKQAVLRIPVDESGRNKVIIKRIGT
jgi:hypothetical protein